MDAASQNSSFLLAGLISGQGAGLSVGGPAQATEKSTEIVGTSFMSSLNQINQQLQLNGEKPTPALEMEGLLQAVDELLAGHAATNGTDLPLLQGQGFAADMSNEDVLSVISQLQGEGTEALAVQLQSLLQQQSDMQITPQQNQQIDAVFAQIRQFLASTSASASITNQQPVNLDPTVLSAAQSLGTSLPLHSSSPFTQQSVANIELGEQLVQQSQAGDRRLMERLNAILPQQAQATEAEKAAVNLKQVFTEPSQNQLAENRDLVQTTVMAKEFVNNPVVTQMPIQLERMAAMSNERQLNLNSELMDWAESGKETATIAQLGKAATTQTNSAVRPMPGFIQTPITSPQWQTDFSDKITMMSRNVAPGQNQVAEIRLNPANMGSIEVRVVMKDDQASITFSAQHGAVREAIESSLPRLREMFNNSGLMLADAEVSEHALQQGQQQNQQSGQDDGPYGHADSGLSSDEQADLIARIDLSAMSPPQGLDLYA